ncbi:MAG: hypothetical protein ABJ256_13275 [Nisaea sp.]
MAMLSSRDAINLFTIASLARAYAQKTDESTVASDAIIFKSNLTHTSNPVSILLFGTRKPYMKILMRHEQTPGLFRSVRFKLWGKVELEGDEQAIIDRYDFDQAKLITEEIEGLMKWSVIIGVVTVVPAFFVWAGFFGRAIGTPTALATGAFAGWLFYDRFRETVYVKDLLYGRHFRCKSIVDISIREERLRQMVAYLRAVMESAKHWGGTQTTDVPPLDPETSRRIMLRGFARGW